MSARAQPDVASPSRRSQAPPRRSSFFHALRFRESYVAWIFIAPALVGFFTFYLMPAFRALYISLTDWNLLRIPRFIGPANFSKLWNDANFWNSMRVTVLYVLYNIPIQTVIGLFLAALLARLRRSVTLR